MVSGNASTHGVEYTHVDVFSARPYTGNSVAVVLDAPPLTESQMATITRELRHFETIFVSRQRGAHSAQARVFDLEGELAFAGHPVMGAAAVLHNAAHTDVGMTVTWSVELAARTVTVDTVSDGSRLSASLDQGRPDVVATPPTSSLPEIAASIGLSSDDLDDDLVPEVLSTGLRYLIVPVRSAEALSRARISRADFTEFLAQHDAEFVYVLHPGGIEGRHWNNDGVLEDVATGSAAGCVAAYLLRHGLTRDAEVSALRQGRYVGRPSILEIVAFGDAASVDRVVVTGDVSLVATGRLHALPEA